jgi:hypothetical protein
MMPIKEELQFALKDNDKAGDTTENMDKITKMIGFLIIILIYIWWSQL